MFLLLATQPQPCSVRVPRLCPKLATTLPVFTCWFSGQHRTRASRGASIIPGTLTPTHLFFQESSQASSFYCCRQLLTQVQGKYPLHPALPKDLWGLLIS